MNSNDRIRMILDKQIPDRIGAFEHFWPETLADEWLSQGYPEGANPYKYFDYDIIACGPWEWFDSTPFIGRKEIIEETEDWVIYKNGRGATLKEMKRTSPCPEHISFEVTSPPAWQAYRDQLDHFDENRLNNMDKVLADLQWARDNNKYSIFNYIFVFEQLRAIIGDEHFLPALITDPDWIKDVCEVLTNLYIEAYDHVFVNYGKPDGFLMYEDYGYNHGLFCSPQMIRDLIFPFEKKFIGFLKDHGLQVIMHSCGDIRKAVPLFIEMGIDCLQPMEAKAGCDISEIGSEYGSSLSYMGNIDITVLSMNDKNKIECEIVSKLKKIKELKLPYVFHTDHSIPPNVNLESYKYALEVFKENACY
ncbi:MAG: uroporphyrinogen decarboxylase family protein [Nitrospinales bacterium]